MVWRTLITFFYKELIDSLKSEQPYINCDLLLNILYTSYNFQRTLKLIKRNVI